MSEFIQSIRRRNAFPAAIFVLAVCTSALVLFMVPEALQSGFGIVTFAAMTAFGLALLFMQVREVPLRKQLLVLWWTLLFGEALFSRWELPATHASRMSGAAYGEALLWVVTFCAVLLLGGTRRDLYTALFSRPYVWLTAFAVLCTLRFSPNPLMSTAWSLKLWTAILILALYALESRGVRDVVPLLETTLWGMAVLTVWPVIRALVQTSFPFFEDGRISPDAAAAHPVAISGRGSLLLLLALTLHVVDRRRSRLILAAVGLTVAVLAAGKAAIVGALVAGIVMFALQRRMAALVAAITSAAVIAVLVLTLTPVSSYFSDYAESDQSGTLSGRTTMWEESIPRIREAPLLGHGYMASKYISDELRLDFSAGHLHNAVLDVAYNLGGAGVVLLFGMVAYVIASLIAIRRRAGGTPLGLLMSGVCAILVYLLIKAATEPDIGGRASDSFMTFLCCFTIAAILRPRLAALFYRPGKSPMQFAGSGPVHPISYEPIPGAARE
jgi:O-antigen ligase